MSEHPAPAELGVLLEGGLTPLREREVLRHLLSCESCRAEVGRGRFSLKGARRGEIPPDVEAAYDRALDSVGRTARYLDGEMAQARQASALLETGGASALFSQGDIPLAGFGVYQALIERCWAVRLHKPREMVSLARCAVEVALRLNPEELSDPQRGDLLAQAWGALGNAFRAADNLPEAERAFTEAFSVFERQGSGAPELKARLYDLLSSLHGTRRNFTLAFTALDMAYAIYKEIRDFHAAGRVLIKKAIYLHYNDQTEEAILINKKGVALIDLKREPDLLGLTVHNELSFLVACNRFSEARKALFRNRPRLSEIGRVHALKIRWLEGQISHGLRELYSAEEAFLEARDGLEEEGLGYAAALASLDLGLVWMRQNRIREASEITAKAAQVFISLQIRVHALAAVLLLRDAFEMDMATLTLFESVVEFVRRSEIDPEARFVPPTV